jgi:hypothetical protein
MSERSSLFDNSRDNFFRRGIFGDSWARKFVVQDSLETIWWAIRKLWR